MNCRIQVEHPVTEAVTGLDLVAEQLRIAAGEPLSVAQDDVAVERPRGRGAADRRGRARAEPRRSTRFAVPDLTGLRVDTHCAAGALIPPYYDSLMAKLIGHGADRATRRRRRCATALAGLEVEGVERNRALLATILAHPDFAAGAVTTR